MLKTAASIYLLIGLLLVAIGPAGKSITRAVNDVKKAATLNIRVGRKSVPSYKIKLFQLIITIGFIALWPLFLPGVLKENHK